MSISGLFFSFEGRISRLAFWLGILVISIIFVLSNSSFVILWGRRQLPDGVRYAVLAAILFWPFAALLVKRFHDLDKSGWRALLILIPLVQLWFIIEVCFVGSEEHHNRFGPRRPLFDDDTAMVNNARVRRLMDKRDFSDGYIANLNKESTQSKPRNAPSQRFGRRGA
jgi:uncharacterized membrane protein YhaH (DUF805 family)